MRAKDNPRGVIAFVVLGFLRLLRWAGNGWATNTYERFVQCIGGVMYYPPGKPPSVPLQAHESVHEWQTRHFGQLRYLAKYYLTRKGRRHAEAQAYAREVAEFGRNAEERARTAADPVYMMGWTPAEARELIDRYVEAYLKTWPNPARWE